MKLRYKALAVTALLFLAAGLYWRLMRQPPPALKPPVEVQLLPGEKEKVVVNTTTRRVVHLTPTSHEELTGVRHLEITVGEDRSVEVKIRKMGLCFEPGIGVVGGASGVGPGLDAAFLYYRHFTVLGGFYLRLRRSPAFTPYIGLGYTPSNILFSNTTGFVGVNVKAEPVLGLRLRF